jgi:hypothetical protein
MIEGNQKRISLLSHRCYWIKSDHDYTKIVEFTMIVNSTINLRNRRASDYLQDDQRDGQTYVASDVFLRGPSLLYLWIGVGIFNLQSLDPSDVEKTSVSTDKDGIWRLIG